MKEFSMHLNNLNLHDKNMKHNSDTSGTSIASDLSYPFSPSKISLSHPSTASPRKSPRRKNPFTALFKYGSKHGSKNGSNRALEHKFVVIQKQASESTIGVKDAGSGPALSRASSQKLAPRTNTESKSDTSDAIHKSARKASPSRPRLSLSPSRSRASGLTSQDNGTAKKPPMQSQKWVPPSNVFSPATNGGKSKASSRFISSASDLDIQMDVSSRMTTHQVVETMQKASVSERVISNIEDPTKLMKQNSAPFLKRNIETKEITFTCSPNPSQKENTKFVDGMARVPPTPPLTNPDGAFEPPTPSFTTKRNKSPQSRHPRRRASISGPTRMESARVLKKWEAPNSSRRERRRISINDFDLVGPLPSNQIESQQPRLRAKRRASLASTRRSDIEGAAAEEQAVVGAIPRFIKITDSAPHAIDEEAQARIKETAEKTQAILAQLGNGQEDSAAVLAMLELQVQALREEVNSSHFQKRDGRVLERSDSDVSSLAADEATIYQTPFDNTS